MEERYVARRRLASEYMERLMNSLGADLRQRALTELRPLLDWASDELEDAAGAGPDPESPECRREMETTYAEVLERLSARLG